MLTILACNDAEFFTPHGRHVVIAVAVLAIVGGSGSVLLDIGYLFWKRRREMRELNRRRK